jgi:hypothetical protein
MRKAQYTVTGKDVQEHTESLLQKHLRRRDHSKKCQAATLYHVVFAAAARLASTYAACLHLKNAPTGETIRKALLSTLPEYAELQKGVNRCPCSGGQPLFLRGSRRGRIPLLAGPPQTNVPLVHFLDWVRNYGPLCGNSNGGDVASP